MEGNAVPSPVTGRSVAAMMRQGPSPAESQLILGRDFAGRRDDETPRR